MSTMLESQLSSLSQNALQHRDSGLRFLSTAAANFNVLISSFLLRPDVPADINLNSPNRGVASEPANSLSDVPVGGAMGNPANPAPPPGLTEEEAEELRSELAKVVSVTF